MQRPLRDELVQNLNDDFGDIVSSGRIVAGGPLPSEELHLGLPRLRFVFNRRDVGRLRLLIDRINEMDAVNDESSG